MVLLWDYHEVTIGLLYDDCGITIGLPYDLYRTTRSPSTKSYEIKRNTMDLIKSN